MKYAEKEAKYYQEFFYHVYEIATRADQGDISHEAGIDMINAYIAVVEDLTVETPIQDYEKAMETHGEKYETARVCFNKAKRTYETRECAYRRLVGVQQDIMRK